MSRGKPKRPRDLMDVLIDRPGPGGPGEDDDDSRTAPASPSWRARTGGRALALALLGVAFGFLLLLVPGVVAGRQVGEWRRGERYRPRFAWALGGVALWAAALGVLAFSGVFGFALILGVIALPIVIRVAARE